MRKNKSKILAVCVMIMMAFSLASCGISRTIIDVIDTVEEIADAVNEGVGIIMQGVTSFAIDEMGGGPIVNLVADIEPGGDLYVSLANNAISIRTHGEDTIRVDFSPPTTGNYVVPEGSFNRAENRLEITEEPMTGFISTEDRPGVVHIYLPQNAAAHSLINLSTANGAVRIIGDGLALAESVSITITNGMVELRFFNADDITINATNGTISGSGLAVGNLEMRTTNGIITLMDSDISGDLTARTTSGGVTLTNVDANMDRADLNAVNGIVTVR
ncbi:MAG: DUF4097 family beta strand repeat-containing protein [Defluviitaleaceae bacterium]|nr:DUF4097 family beta strand repeat-containing protein [Defluviitaleaceae bacterium]